MKEWIGKKVKIFIRNLDFKPIVYTAEVLSVEGSFITFRDRTDKIISINLADVIQVKGAEDGNF
jgi:predicted choloylglycine hydrolase